MSTEDLVSLAAQDTAASASGQTRRQFTGPPELPPNLRPTFIRLPKPGRACPFSGLSRTQIYTLCREGKVRSISLRRKGASRGVRLIDFESLCAAIEMFA